LRVLFHDDDVGAQNDFESAPAGDAVDGADDGLVEITRIVESAKSSDSPVGIGLLAAGGRLEVPAGRKEFLAAAGDDRNAKLGVIAERREDRIQPAAGEKIDGVGLA